jgi:D-3-phosphoglycerate dehydrogenase
VAATGTWDRSNLARYDARLLGRVGVVGLGVIGSRVAEVLRALGAEVVELRRGDAIPLDLDVLSLHASLTAENRGMVSAELIGRLRPGTIVVNTARGKLLDAGAALAAVHAGQLGGLGVDVFPEEPADLSRFLHDRVIVTPHAAGWHPRLGEDIADGVRDAVLALVQAAPVPWAI